MSRKLPLCAKCGEALVRSNRVVLGFEGAPGQPEVGWHEGCVTKDSMWGLFLDDLKRDSKSFSNAENLLRKVEKRGEGRVVAGKAWSKVRIR